MTPDPLDTVDDEPDSMTVKEICARLERGTLSDTWRREIELFMRSTGMLVR